MEQTRVAKQSHCDIVQICERPVQTHVQNSREFSKASAPARARASDSQPHSLGASQPEDVYRVVYFPQKVSSPLLSPDR